MLWRRFKKLILLVLSLFLAHYLYVFLSLRTVSDPILFEEIREKAIVVFTHDNAHGFGSSARSSYAWKQTRAMAKQICHDWGYNVVEESIRGKNRVDCMKRDEVNMCLTNRTYMDYQCIK